MNNKYSIAIAKKELEKAIINELSKKNVIDICQFNKITKQLDDEISKYRLKIDESEKMNKLVVKIPL